MKRLAALACAAVGVGVAFAAQSCSGGGDTSSSDDASDDRRYGDANTDAQATDGGNAEGAAPFSVVGWNALEGFDPGCPMYVAPSPDKFPPPNAWEPCDARTHVLDGGSLSCRQIADNWGAGGDPSLMPIGPVNSAYWDPVAQTVTIPILRFTPNALVYVVADADGPVRGAVASLAAQCSLDYFTSISKKNVIYNINLMTPDQQTLVRSGALGGAFASPQVLRNYSGSSISLGYVAGANEFVEFGSQGFDTGSWGDGGRLDTLSTSAPGQVDQLQFQGDDLFIGVNDLTYGRVQHYVPDAGVTDFVSFGTDTQSFAADFGTDGVDMVWSEAFGHPSDSSPWTTINIVTAPYTTNAGAITKRRLRSETITPGTERFVVGCGYAAHGFVNGDTERGVRVVRISDGQSWRISVPAGDALAWNHPIAVTCQEVFLNFNFGSGKTNIARIRLDSLGTGDPHD